MPVSLRVNATDRVLWQRNNDLDLMAKHASQTGCTPAPVICAISKKAINTGVDLSDQNRACRFIANVLCRQFESDNVARVYIESVMQLAPGFPRLRSAMILGIPTAPTMRLEPCCLDNERDQTARTARVILDLQHSAAAGKR